MAKWQIKYKLFVFKSKITKTNLR